MGKNLFSICIILTLIGSANAMANRFQSRGCYLYSSTFNQYVDKYDRLMIKLQEMGIHSVFLSTSVGVLGDNGPIYTSRVKDFNKQAHFRNITVHAMYLQSYVYIDDYKSAIVATDKVIDYNNNATVEERFDGVHLDVEPHTHPDWSSQDGYLPGSTVNENIMQNFIGLLDTLQSQLENAVQNGSDTLYSSADQTYWIHDKVESGNLNTGHINHLLEHVDFVTLFDYTDDDDKLVRFVSAEINAAFRPNSVVIALKTTDDRINPDQTFYDNGWLAFDRADRNLHQYFASENSFLATCIFEYNSLREMYENRFPGGFITSIEDDFYEDDDLSASAPGEWTRDGDVLVEAGITDSLDNIHYGNKAVFYKADWDKANDAGVLRYQLGAAGQDSIQDWSATPKISFWAKTDIDNSAQVKFAIIEADGDFWRTLIGFTLTDSYEEYAILLSSSSLERINDTGDGNLELNAVKYIEFSIEKAGALGVKTYYFDDVLRSQFNIYPEGVITSIEYDIYENDPPSRGSPGEWTRWGTILTAAGITDNPSNVYSGNKAIYYKCNWANGNQGGLRYQLGSEGIESIQDWNDAPLVSFWAKADAVDGSSLNFEFIEEDGDRWRVKTGITPANHYEKYTVILDETNFENKDSSGGRIFSLKRIKYIGFVFYKNSATGQNAYYFDEFTRGVETSIYHKSNIIEDFKLMQNYPNPFNSMTIITYTLPEDSKVKLVIYDLLGREVKILINEWQNSGTFKCKYNANNLASGLYIYQLQVKNITIIRKMAFVE